MDERACPSVDEIRDFLNEQLAPARDQEVSLHIQECPSCSELMTTVADSDETQSDSDLLPVLAEIRTLQKDHGFEAEDACLQAVARARQIPERSSSSAADSGSHNAVSRVKPPPKLGPYELGTEIGTGGMGSVYRATHSKLGRTVAVKVLHGRRLSQPDAIARFEREMKAVGQLEHPNIVRATDADEDDGVQYLVMEYLDGIDLSSLVRQHGPLPVPEACELVRQAAQGLQHAHENGFVHRDVKPANLMLSRGNSADGQTSPVVKVLDLGLAMVDVLETGDALTSTGQAMGTIEYMAPEQFDETSLVDIRADIYGLGATLYKLLTGHSPLENGQPRSRLQKLKALVTEEPTPISDHRSDLPAELVDIIGRMLARVPDDRFATPREVAEALLNYSVGNDLPGLLNSTGPNQSSAFVANRTPASSRQTPRGGRLLGASIAALAIVALIVVIQKDPAPTPSNSELPPPQVARTTSIRLEGRTLIFEGRDNSAIDITVRTDGPRLVLQREVGVFEANVGDGGGTATFSIGTSEFDAFRMQLGQGDDQLTLEDISGINGDLLIDSGKGNDQIDVTGVIELGSSSLTVNVSRIVTRLGSHISTFGNGNIRLNAIVQSAREPGAAILMHRDSGIRTEHGDITLTGDASSYSELPINGVFVEGAEIATESGAVTLRGRASTGFDDHPYWGVALNYGASVSSTGTGAEVGQISIDGVGGVGGSHNQGIHVLRSAIHSQTAEIYLSGHGGSGSVRNDGIRMESSTIESHDGSIRISGTGGSGGAEGDSCLGVAIIMDAHVRTTGQGHILINGIGGHEGRAGAENHIGIDFGSSRSAGLMATLRSANGNVTLRGRAGTGVSRGVVLGGDVISDEGTISILGEGAGEAADVHWIDGVVGDDTSHGDITLTADSLNVTGGSVHTSGHVVVQTRTDEMDLQLTDAPNANYFRASGWSVFSSRIGSLTIHDQRGHAWRRRASDGQLQWSQLINGEETSSLPDEPSFAVKWAAPRRLAAPLDQLQSCSFTADEMTVVFTSRQSGTVGGSDVWMAERPSANVPFTDVRNLGELFNTVQSEYCPCISSDGLTLVYASNCTATQERGSARIWMAKRTDRQEPFSQPVKLPLLEEVSEAERWVSYPNLSADGTELFFAANTQNSRDTDIYVATRRDSDSDFGRARRLSNSVNTSSSEMYPTIHPNGSVLVFASAREGGLGGHDLWASRRSTSDSAFGPAVHLGNTINSPTSETAPFISRDGRTLYFAAKESRTKTAKVFLYQTAFPTAIFSQ